METAQAQAIVTEAAAAVVGNQRATQVLEAGRIQATAGLEQLLDPAIARYPRGAPTWKRRVR